MQFRGWDSGCRVHAEGRLIAGGLSGAAVECCHKEGSGALANLAEQMTRVTIALLSAWAAVPGHFCQIRHDASAVRYESYLLRSRRGQ
jgi:hypothetical protein